jgi:hypothetical protein
MTVEEVRGEGADLTCGDGGKISRLSQLGVLSKHRSTMEFGCSPCALVLATDLLPKQKDNGHAES